LVVVATSQVRTLTADVRKVFLAIVLSQE